MIFKCVFACFKYMRNKKTLMAAERLSIPPHKAAFILDFVIDMWYSLDIKGTVLAVPHFYDLKISRLVW